MGCTLLLVISLRPSALSKPLDLECFREARKIPCDDDTREKRAAGGGGLRVRACWRVCGCVGDALTYVQRKAI